MKWFEHSSTLRDQAEFKEAIRHGGIVAYGCAVAVLEILAQYRKEDGGAFALSLKDKRFGWAFWRDELHLASLGAAAKVIFLLASCGILDQDDLEQRGLVSAPMLQDLMDSYGKKRRRQAVA